jgi:hypothetical protein
VTEITARHVSLFEFWHNGATAGLLLPWDKVYQGLIGEVL